MENKKHIEDEINFSEIVADPVNFVKAIFPYFMIKSNISHGQNHGKYSCERR